MKTFYSGFRMALLMMIFLYSFSLFSQQNTIQGEKKIQPAVSDTKEISIERCGTMEYLQSKLAANPSLAVSFAAFEKAQAERRKKLFASAQDLNGVPPIVIPVVVHILWNVEAENISDRRVFEQISILNRDYAGLNPGSMGLFDPALKVNTNLRFRLAKIDPSGNCTQGIERRQTTVTSFPHPSDDMKHFATGGLNAWDPDQYLNIWVCNLSDLLGFGAFPSLGVDDNFGVVIDFSAFGLTDALAPYNLGGTTTHELGHCFDLHHVWGDSTNSIDPAYFSDDACNDVPPQLRATYGFHSGLRTDPRSVNSPGIMYMNFMDYVYDYAYANFTPDQVVRMQACFAAGGPLESLANSDKAGEIIFVNSDAAGDDDGSSWENAYTNLHTAIQAAGFGVQIWVKAGLYVPTGNGAGADMHFALKNCVEIYGGFAGNEDPFTFLMFNRNFEENVSVLSGQLSCYHVVVASNVDTTAVLDGFKITEGWAWPETVDQCAATNNCVGAGMLNLYADPTIRNCIFTINSAFEIGGGMANRSNSNPHLYNCIFTDNQAHMGAGLGNIQGSAVIVNSTFYENEAEGAGGGIFNMGSILLINSILYSNTVLQPCYPEENLFCGHQVYNAPGASMIMNSCCYRNTANLDIYNEAGVIFVTVNCTENDPLFISPPEDLRLQPASPAINSGNGLLLLPSQVIADRDGNPRIIGATIDMGPYEHVEVICPSNNAALRDEPLVYLLSRNNPALNPSPPGGTFSGPGVAFSYFYPLLVGVGNQTLTYTYTNPTTGLSESSTFDMDVLNILNGIIHWDFGDAPAPYPTLLANNGPRHGDWADSPASPRLSLGFVPPDFEADGQPSPGANGDDNDANGDDEDGVNIPLLIPGFAADITVTTRQFVLNGDGSPNFDRARGSYLLNAWIDYNKDGDWDEADEQVFTNCITWNTPNVLSLTVPLNAVPGITTARFRFSSFPASATGWARNGEIEDYNVYIFNNLVLMGTLTYDNELQSPLTGIIVFLKQQGTILDSTISDSTGYYEFTDLLPGTYSLDATTTMPVGGINASDALLVLRHFVNLDTLTGLRYRAGDVNNSGGINAIDALLIAKRFVGLIDSFSVPDWLFENAEVVLNPDTVVTLNYKGICSGDVNGSYVPGNQAASPFVLHP